MMDDPNQLANEEEFLDSDSREALERTQRKLVAKVEELADGGGKKITRHHKCQACGTVSAVEFDIENPELVVKALSAVSAARQRAQSQRGDDASEAATKLLRDRSALSDEELAEYIARLEAELGA